jgi:quinol monooxygenase YgiN
MTEVSAIARLKIHEGKLEEFKRLAALCVDSVRTKDSGTLQYDYFFNDDYTECVVVEHYRDFAAMREHLANIGDDLMQALFKVCSMSGDILAAPTPELRKAIEGFDIRLYSPYQPV